MGRFSAMTVTIVLALAPFLANAAAAAEDYVGRVNLIVDASTVRITYKGGQIRVKLAGAEGAEPDRAREVLSERLLGREVRVERATWQDGYLVGHVYVDGRDVATELLGDGPADP